MQFEMQLAARHLKSGGWQTILTVSAVATAVTVIIFITSLIRGVQERLIDDLIGSIAHVTVKAPELQPQTLAEALGEQQKGNRILSTKREKQEQQQKEIVGWSRLETQIASFPGVYAVAATVRGQAFLIRGPKRFGITVSGADPLKQERISELQSNIVAGNWLSVGPNDIVIGYRLAEEAGLGLGDRVRIQSSEGVSSIFTIAGIFNTGIDIQDLSTAFVTLRAAQTLFAIGSNASTISVKLDDAFMANDVADEISGALPYKTESWMRQEAQFMDALKTQNSTSAMISAFSLLASSLSIAAVLIVSVIQKSKQIGILKSMGARNKQILLVFTLEGLGIAIIGAIMGAGLSYALLRYLMSFKRAVNIGKIDQLYPAIIDARIFAVAMLAAIMATVLAAILPARRAARLNPVDVIHGN